MNYHGSVLMPGRFFRKPLKSHCLQSTETNSSVRPQSDQQKSAWKNTTSHSSEQSRSVSAAGCWCRGLAAPWCEMYCCHFHAAQLTDDHVFPQSIPILCASAEIGHLYFVVSYLQCFDAWFFKLTYLQNRLHRHVVPALYDITQTQHWRPTYMPKHLFHSMNVVFFSFFIIHLIIILKDWVVNRRDNFLELLNPLCVCVCVCVCVMVWLDTAGTCPILKFNFTSWWFCLNEAIHNYSKTF